MATVPYVIVPAEPSTPSRAITVLWSPLTNTDTDGQAFLSQFYVDKSVEVVGIFGGATVILQGTNAVNPSAGDWNTLHKIDLSALSFTSQGVHVVLENVVNYRPLLVGGDGSTALIVRLLCASSARR